MVHVLDFLEEGLNHLAGKAESPLYRCGYKGGSAGSFARCTQSLYRLVPYERANVASYQHLIQIASCSFNEVALWLGGVTK